MVRDSKTLRCCCFKVATTVIMLSTQRAPSVLCVPRLPAILPAGPVTLCRNRVADAADVSAAIEASIDDLRPWMDWAADGVPSESAQREAFRRGEAAFEDGAEFGYVLREVATGEVVGGCGLHPRVGTGGIEMGYWVRSDRHSRGYATAAARALTAASFDWLPEVDRVEIHVDEGNTASARVPGKLGYRPERREQRERVAPGQTGSFVLVPEGRRSITRPIGGMVGASSVTRGPWKPSGSAVAASSRRAISSRVKR